MWWCEISTGNSISIQNTSLSMFISPNLAHSLDFQLIWSKILWVSAQAHAHTRTHTRRQSIIKVVEWILKFDAIILVCILLWRFQFESISGTHTRFILIEHWILHWTSKRERPKYEFYILRNIDWMIIKKSSILLYDRVDQICLLWYCASQQFQFSFKWVEYSSAALQMRSTKAIQAVSLQSDAKWNYLLQFLNCFHLPNGFISIETSSVEEKNCRHCCKFRFH